MRTKTDAELRDLGWKWALRSADGDLQAVTVDPRDCAEWIRDQRGIVVCLQITWER